MIYICTATYFEGESFIKALQLKKDTNYDKFQIFKNADVTLLITGVGKIKAAAAIMYLFAKNEPAHNDILINYGLCSTKQKEINLGCTFLCNKLIDNGSKKTYYPDILYKHNFSEKSIETFEYIVNKDSNITADLADMESTGIYQSALYYSKTDQIFFIKTVSDYSNENDIKKDLLRLQIENATKNIIKWINMLKENLQKEEAVLNFKDIELVDKLSSNLKLSVSMKNELVKELSYFKLSEGEIPDSLNKYTNVECNSKKEGKEYVKCIREELIK